MATCSVWHSSESQVFFARRSRSLSGIRELGLFPAREAAETGIAHHPQFWCRHGSDHGDCAGVVGADRRLADRPSTCRHWPDWPAVGHKAGHTNWPSCRVVFFILGLAG